MEYIIKIAELFLAFIMLFSGSGHHFDTVSTAYDRPAVTVPEVEEGPEDAIVSEALKYDGLTQEQMIKERGDDYRTAWCCYFVTDMARLADLSYAIPYEGSCSALFKTLTEDMGAKVVTEPRKGDLLFFLSTREKVKPYLHIALVTEVNGNNISVIHGNYNNKVSLRNNTGFNDGKGNSTFTGTLKRVYVRPSYTKNDYNP